MQDTNEVTEEHVKAELEETANAFSMARGMRAEEILGAAVPYRNFISQNLREAGQVPPQTFIAWMESADRTVVDVPERGVEFLEALDSCLIRAVREENLQPSVAVSALDSWVEESKAEMIKMHDLPDDFFEEASP